MINIAAKSSSLKWYFPFLWIAISTILSPIAISAGLVATYIIAPWNTGPIDHQAPPDPIALLILRSTAFGVIAGGILELPRSIMLHQFLDSPLWIPVTMAGLTTAMFAIYYNQGSTSRGDWMWPNCLADLSSQLVVLAPLVLPGVLQSLLLASQRHRWYFWLIAGSTSYILPLSGSMACSINGFLAGSFIAAVITVISLPITLKNS